MKPQRTKPMDRCDASPPKVGFCERARNGLCRGEQPTRRFGRPGWSRRQLLAYSPHGSWQAQKQPRLVEHIAHAVEPAVHGDEIEQVAMFARRRIGPFAGGALAAVGSLEPDEQAPPWRVSHIAKQPVPALPAAIGEIVAAHRFGMARETMGQVSRFG
jgi:hypothetical protein